MQSDAIQYDTMQYDTIKCDARKYGMMRYTTLQYDTKYNTIYNSSMGYFEKNLSVNQSASDKKFY